MVGSLSDETVTLKGVRANVVTNTADADIEFVVCRAVERFIALYGALDRLCEQTAPIEGRRLPVASGARETIVMRVTPHRKGLVVVRGMTVDYHRGAAHLWQRGSEGEGPVVRIRVR